MTDYMRDVILSALSEAEYERMMTLADISPEDLQKAQGIIRGLKIAERIVNECYQRASAAS